MPTHTYLALGLWDKVVTSNIVSWKAEQARKEKKNLDNNALAYHAYHWLEYGQLQLGQNEIAKAMVDSMLQYCTALPSPRARAHAILLKSTYLAETNDYSSPIIDITVDQRDLNIVSRAKNYFVTGMAASIGSDLALFRTLLSAISLRSHTLPKADIVAPVMAENPRALPWLP